MTNNKILLLISFLIFHFLACERIITEIVPQQEVSTAISFWTEERLAKAVPMDILLRQEGYPPFNTSVEILENGTDFVPEDQYDKKPFAQSGKVFFVYNGGYASCSGTATGGNAVITAGIFLCGCVIT